MAVGNISYVPECAVCSPSGCTLAFAQYRRLSSRAHSTAVQLWTATNSSGIAVRALFTLLHSLSMIQKLLRCQLQRIQDTYIVCCT
jgi:hypothetical protein